MNAVIRLLLPMLCAAMLWGCQTSPERPIAAERQVLLINSDSSVPRYRIAEQAFMETYRNPAVIQIDLAGDPRPTETLQDALNRHAVAAVYSIGAKALGSIDYLAPAAPVVYSSVLSWRQFQHKAHFHGVASEVSPAQQLAWFKHFFPKIQRIGVLFSDHNSAMIKEAEAAASALSITLVAAPIHERFDRATQAQQLSAQVDALWVLPDPQVLDSQPNTLALFKGAQAANTPVFSYHSVFMEFGATLSINADQPTMGRQAALMIQTLMNNSNGLRSIQNPAGSDISLNLTQVKATGLELNADALHSVNTLLE